MAVGIRKKGDRRDIYQLDQIGFSRFLTTGAPTLLNRLIMLKAITKDRTVVDAEHTLTAERQDNEWLFAATIKPVG